MLCNMENGRYQLGDEVPFALLCTDSNHKPTAPDAAPTLNIYNSAGLNVVSRQIAPVDRRIVTGLFGFSLILDSRFVVGAYVVAYSYKLSGVSYLRTEQFEVIDGGSNQGIAISMYEFNRPQGKFIIAHTTTGMIVAGRNPRT